MSPTIARDSRSRRDAFDADVGNSGGVRPRRDFDHLSFVVPRHRQHACRRRDVLVRPRRIHAGRHPDVRDDGRRDRLVAGRQGPLRSARPLALPRARRTGDFQSRRLRHLRRAHRLVAGLLRGHRQDGHSGDAAARLSGRRGHRLDLRRRHARHPDSAVDHLHPLRHCHRNLDRPSVPRRRDAGPDADRHVHAVDDLHHLEARLPLACDRFSLFLEGKIPVDPEDRAVPADYFRRHVLALWRRGDAVGSGRRRRRALPHFGGPDLPALEDGPDLAHPARHHARSR